MRQSLTPLTEHLTHWILIWTQPSPSTENLARIAEPIAVDPVLTAEECPKERCRMNAHPPARTSNIHLGTQNVFRQAPFDPESPQARSKSNAIKSFVDILYLPQSMLSNLHLRQMKKRSTTPYSWRKVLVHQNSPTAYHNAA
jgi:hypothetical protein